MCLLATVAPAARAIDPYVVDVQECARNNGQATVPAGAPISVQNFAFVTGTYGLMQNFLLKQEDLAGRRATGWWHADAGRGD